MKAPELPESVGRILGLGIDIVASERVRRMKAVHGSRFLARCFTDSEAEYCMSRKDPIPDLAVRLAAKEACFKAIGGRRGMGLGWRGFEVVLDSQGVPEMSLRDAAQARGEMLGVSRIWMSLTHEDDWSGAVVIMTGEDQNA